MRALRLLPLLCAPFAAHAYSVLTHEAIIDSAWDDAIRPALLARFPNATPAELKQAHAFAYGGAIIQDSGYYPGGSRLFGNLTHYIRTGDFVLNLIRDGKTLNEYAFALGALAHYPADELGHSIAVNRVVPILYPKVRRRFGLIATYEDNETDHLRAEFAFDVLQVSRGTYAPAAYHDFIGFAVPKDFLDRGVQDTYCLSLEDMTRNVDHALNSYRHAVSSTIPEATKVAWVIKGNDIRKRAPGIERRKFVYNIERSSYEKEWGRDYERPSLKDRVLAFLIRLLPKIGPLRYLAFQTPNAQAESLFEKSFDRTLTEYRQLVKGAANGTLVLENINLDTGKVEPPGSYRLADQTQQDWQRLVATKQPGAACSAARR